MRLISKIFQPPQKYLAFLHLVFYKYFVPVTRNFVGILSALKRRVFGRENIFFVEIILTENSPVLIRNLLIALNRICGQTLSAGHKTGKLAVHMRKDVQFDNLDEIFSCFHLIPLLVDTAFCLDEYLHSRQISFSEKLDGNEATPAKGFNAFIGDSHLSVNIEDYFKECKKNYLDLPVSTKVWARNILKGYPPGSYIISVHLPEFTREEKTEILGAWDVFFRRSWEDLPRLHFIVLNTLTASEEELLYTMPNVTSTKILGHNFLEEVALVRFSDMYIGAYDKYAAAVIGTNKPFLLTGLSEDDAPQIYNKMKHGKRELSLSNCQTWISDFHSPVEFYMEFRKFYNHV